MACTKLDQFLATPSISNCLIAIFQKRLEIFSPNFHILLYSLFPLIPSLPNILHTSYFFSYFHLNVKNFVFFPLFRASRPNFRSFAKFIQRCKNLTSGVHNSIMLLQGKPNSGKSQFFLPSDTTRIYGGLDNTRFMPGLLAKRVQAETNPTRYCIPRIHDVLLAYWQCTCACTKNYKHTYIICTSYTVNIPPPLSLSSASPSRRDFVVLNWDL